MAHDVIISYSSKDKSIADAACARIEAARIRCWMAPRDIVPGQMYPEAISAAIEDARIMVVILSGHANASAHVMREVELAVSSGDVVVPFRVEDVQPSGSLHYLLMSTHWLDAIEPPMEESLDRLVAVLGGLLRGAPLPPPPPPSPSRGPNRLLIGVAALAALAVFGLGLVLLSSGRGAGNNRQGVVALPTPVTVDPSLPTMPSGPEAPTLAGAGLGAATDATDPAGSGLPGGSAGNPTPGGAPVEAPGGGAAEGTPEQPGSDCAVASGERFVGLWTPDMGCPTADTRPTQGGFQRFQHGYMIWRSDRDEIYSVLEEDGRWERHPNRWTGPPELSCPDANTPFGPVRGFGEVWCNRPDLRARLGQAVAGERSVSLLVQDTMLDAHLVGIHSEALTSALSPTGRARTAYQ